MGKKHEQTQDENSRKAKSNDLTQAAAVVGYLQAETAEVVTSLVGIPPSGDVDFPFSSRNRVIPKMT